VSEVTERLEVLDVKRGQLVVWYTDAPDPATAQTLNDWAAPRKVRVVQLPQDVRLTPATLRPGDVVVIHMDVAELTPPKVQALGAWAAEEHVSLLVLPHGVEFEHLDDAALERLGLYRRGKLHLPSQLRNGHTPPGVW
jgi:hypothetical protein